MKKSWRQLVVESLTKTREERYAEMSRNERIGYWVFGFVVVLIMLLIWNSA